MDLFDLPEECILHILEFLPLKGVIACSETCQRLRALMPSNMLWLPRLSDEYGLDLKINPTYMPIVEARSIYRAARQCKPEPAIRFWGCFTDGGCDLNRRQYWMDHLFAPNSLESYCSATMNNVHCVGLLSNPEGAKARDEGKARYRDYLLRRLRVPAGVVFGHGLVDLALIQGSEEVDSAVMQRLQANSLAELEHLFLEFYQELMLGNTVGRLLLHGLVGSQREVERAHMATVAAGIERHISETNEELKVDPGDANRLFDDEALGSLAFSDCGRAGTTVGVIDKLTVSRAGHFSCPILAGVIFIACCNPHACRSLRDVKDAIMSLPSREECRVFDNLKDEATVKDAVRSGKLPPRTMHVACKAGSYYVFGSGASLKGASSAASSTIGPLRPLVWFKFHTRTEASKWRADPVTVWEGQDPDWATPSTAATRSPSTSNAADLTGPSEGEPAAADGMGSSSGPGPVAPASTSAVGSIVGEIAQIAHAWLGGGGRPEAMSESSDSEYKPQELEMASSEEIESSESSEMGADGEEQEGLIAEEDEDEDEDTDVDMDGEPRGTRGRNRLEIMLPGKVAGNLVLVKLIDQEDLMHEWDDQHDDPNIDINHVIFSGCTLNLPPGVALST